MKPCLLFLTCASGAEAEKISRILLEKRLIVCAKRLSVSSSFLWKGKIDSSKEELLIMESSQEKFLQVEKTVHQLHSYDTPILISVSITQASRGIIKWISDSLK